jgi:hypothetical protein
MNKILLNEVNKIHATQPTCALAVLMSIRSRIEQKMGILDRIGNLYGEGSRGVLIIGKAGTGKTRFLRSIYDGLGLEYGNGRWLSSVGASTGVGVFEILEMFNDSIIFADELNLNTPMHRHVIKQISNGEILKPKHKDIDPTPFTGLVVSATNGVKVPRGHSELEDLLAVLDRFMIVKSYAPKHNASNIMKMVLRGNKSNDPNWHDIATALTNPKALMLSDGEQDELALMWDEKAKEILDPGRAQFRMCHAAKDIFLFVKRFFSIDNMCKDKEALGLVRTMMDDCILFNPIGILHLDPIEEVIYKKVKSKSCVETKEIFVAVEKSGMAMSRQYLHRVIDRMVNNRIFYRTRKGQYSLKVVVENKKSASNTLDEVKKMMEGCL